MAKSGTVWRSPNSCPPSTDGRQSADPLPGVEEFEIVFAKSGVTAMWNPDCESLLDFAEEQGLTPDFGCRAGACHSCLCNLLAGAIDYFEEPENFNENEGAVLLCCAKPKTNPILDI